MALTWCHKGTPKADASAATHLPLFAHFSGSMGGGASSLKPSILTESSVETSPASTPQRTLSNNDLQRFQYVPFVAQEDTLALFYFPQFTGYTNDTFGPKEIERTNCSRLQLNAVPTFLEFDHALLGNLYTYCGSFPMVGKPFSFKQKYILGLLKLITANEIAFHRDVVDFVVGNHHGAVHIADYDILCNTVHTSLKAVVQDPTEVDLWARALSRLLRALVAHREEVDLVAGDLTPRL